MGKITLHIKKKKKKIAVTKYDQAFMTRASFCMRLSNISPSLKQQFFWYTFMNTASTNTANLL